MKSCWPDALGHGMVVNAEAKRVWHIQLPGKQPFAMILMDGPVCAEGARKEARLIWPSAEVF